MHPTDIVDQPVTRLAGKGRDILVVAAWFGLVTGLVEGIAFLLFQRVDWLSWDAALTDIAVEIAWISPIFDLLLFGAIGIGLTAVSRVLPRLPVLALTVFVCAFLAFFDWLNVALTGRVLPYALALLAAGLATVVTRRFVRRPQPTLAFWRRSLAWAAGAVLCVFAGVQGGTWFQERLGIAMLPDAPENVPNVLVIVVDTLRADHLSSYGYERATSPNMDRLAAGGVLFENAVSPSSWTSPSHASILTGRYASEHGVEWARPRALLDGPYPTLPEVLRARGYRTAAFSANLFWFTRSMGFGRGFIHFEDVFASVADMAARTLYGRAIERVALRRLGFEDIPARKRAADINRSALGWIDRDPDTPFFVFLNYMDAHDPYLPPEPYRRQFSSLENPGGILNWRLGRNDPQMTQEQRQGEIDAYDGGIAYADHHIGELVSALERRGMLDDTLIVLTSDHGESFGEHGMFLHANALYREVIHVPLMLSWPARLPSGARVQRPVTNAAVAATVMDLLDAASPELFPASSLRPLWETPALDAEWPHPLAELARQPWALKKLPVSQGWSKSLVSPDWQYILHETLGSELYDWRDDPLELNNLAGTPAARDILAQFGRQLSGPALAMGTYLGGSGDDAIREIGIDSNGNIVTVGLVSSAAGFRTATRFGSLGDHDLFVAKLNPDASALLWVTVIGGTGKERGYGVDVDGEDNIYVAGRTSSPNFPTTAGAWDETYNGGTERRDGHHGPSDAFALKLSADGSRLMYSTYLGGSGEDRARGGLAVDAGGQAYVVGATDSKDFLDEGGNPNPAKVNQFLGGESDAFITKLSADGSRIVYSRYLGSSTNSNVIEMAPGVQVDPRGGAWIHMIVGGADAPTTPDAYDRTYNGDADTYIVKLSADGRQLDYATYLGGSGNEFAEHRMALDAHGNVYVTGQTDSADFPAINADQARPAGLPDAYLVKLDPRGQPVFSTYLGGSGEETALGPAVGADGTIFVTGRTESRDLRVTPNAHAAALKGATDAYLRVYAPSGSLLYSTYFGGSGGEFARYVAVDQRGNPIFGGTTSSVDLPTTTGAVQRAMQSKADTFIAKFDWRAAAAEEPLRTAAAAPR